MTKDKIYVIEMAGEQEENMAFYFKNQAEICQKFLKKEYPDKTIVIREVDIFNTFDDWRWVK